MMLTRRQPAALLCLLLLPPAAAAPLSLSSPGGRLVISFQAGSSGLSYNVSHEGRSVLLDSALGLSLYAGGFEVLGHKATENRSRWSPLYGERRVVPDNYNQLTVSLRQVSEPRRPLELTLRAYDEGVALRYTILGRDSFTFESENTEFHFPPGAWGYEEHGTEGGYKKVLVSEIKPDCERPLTIDYGDGLYASLTEAAVVDYPRMLLSPVAGKPGALASALGGPVKGDPPFSTPWRLLIVGRRPGDLLERNYLVLNLNPPQAIRDASWIKPGKAIREVTLSTRGGKACVDFAVRHGLEYIEYDAGWYGHEYDDAQDATTVSPDPKRIAAIPDHGGLDLQEVIRYARHRGIGVWLYVNRRHLERQLDQSLPLYASWGVKGIKFGFVRVGPQEWTSWLHEAVRKAARHRLMVDIHDAYRPTGFSRTYPNLLTQEGVRGNEHMPTAGHNVTLPFTRFIAGAADATICYYTPRIKTTRAHQLAQAVVVYSPLQFLFWYDRPSDYQGEPEVEFFRGVPTVWDDTRVLDGAIGEFIVMARRSGADWFIGCLTGDQGREVDIPLSFLDKGRTYTARIYADGASSTEVRIETRPVSSATRLRARLAPSGGQAIRLAPAPR